MTGVTASLFSILLIHSVSLTVFALTAPNGVDYARRVFKRLKGAAFIKGKDEAYLCDNIAKAFETYNDLPFGFLVELARMTSKTKKEDEEEEDETAEPVAPEVMGMMRELWPKKEEREKLTDSLYNDLLKTCEHELTNIERARVIELANDPFQDLSASK